MGQKPRLVGDDPVNPSPQEPVHLIRVVNGVDVDPDVGPTLGLGKQLLDQCNPTGRSTTETLMGIRRRGRSMQCVIEATHKTKYYRPCLMVARVMDH